MKKTAFILMISLMCSSQSFAEGDVHVECNLTKTNVALKAQAEKQVDDLLRTPASEEVEADTIDSDYVDP